MKSYTPSTLDTGCSVPFWWNERNETVVTTRNSLRDQCVGDSPIRVFKRLHVRLTGRKVTLYVVSHDRPFILGSPSPGSPWSEGR